MQSQGNNRNSQRKQSIRLFRNPVLESLSHVHPIVPLLIWLPLALWLIYRAVAVHQVGLPGLAGIGVAGLVFWTFAEYALHRFVFHFPAKSRLGKRFVFLFHGVHHDDPRDKTRLVMPPVGAAIILAILWVIFSAVIPYPWVEPFTAFFLLGYLTYDYIHYATHHFPMRHPALRYLKQYHMKHHFAGEESRFGVSSPLWDLVFGTYLPPDQRGH
jgi:sterol desaturase/sphingolipid hydroxylase (fatty acid hydroxylase superfamily)